jgi:hypothetical protein
MFCEARIRPSLITAADGIVSLWFMRMCYGWMPNPVPSPN